MTTAKEFLKGIKRLDAIINCKQAQIDELRTRAESVTVPLKPDKIQSGSTGRGANFENGGGRMTNPWCKFCGTQVDFTDIDYEVGAILGQESVLHTHGIEDNVTVILICKRCSREVRQEMGMKQIFDWSEECGGSLN